MTDDTARVNKPLRGVFERLGKPVTDDTARAAHPCSFGPAHEPFYCRVHGDVRLTLNDELCRSNDAKQRRRLGPSWRESMAYEQGFEDGRHALSPDRPSGLLREAAQVLVNMLRDRPATNLTARQWAAVEDLRAALATPDEPVAPTLNDDAYFAAHGHEPYCPADYLIPEGPCDCRASRSRP